MNQPSKNGLPDVPPKSRTTNPPPQGVSHAGGISIDQVQIGEEEKPLFGRNSMRSPDSINAPIKAETIELKRPDGETPNVLSFATQQQDKPQVQKSRLADVEISSPDLDEDSPKTKPKAQKSKEQAKIPVPSQPMTDTELEKAMPSPRELAAIANTDSYSQLIARIYRQDPFVRCDKTNTFLELARKNQVTMEDLALVRSLFTEDRRPQVAKLLVEGFRQPITDFLSDLQYRSRVIAALPPEFAEVCQKEIDIESICKKSQSKLGVDAWLKEAEKRLEPADQETCKNITESNLI